MVSVALLLVVAQHEPMTAAALAVAAALGLMLALTVAAVITIARSSHPTPSPARRRRPGSRLSPLRSRSLRELLLTAALANAALSATEVALIAYVRHHHALWASGPLLAEVSVGSIVVSLLLGARSAAPGIGGASEADGATRQFRRLPRLLAGYTGGLALLTVAGLYPPLPAAAAVSAVIASALGRSRPPAENPVGHEGE
jgi:hypothetical protein